MTDYKAMVGNVGDNQYEKRVDYLKGAGLETTQIESTVKQIDLTAKSKSFVIFGEPQSGKTEMMIALNAYLMDKGYAVVINLMTDNVALLNQSMTRFKAADLSPAPKQFSELPDDASEIRKQPKWIIFSKKNARDLEKLIEQLRLVENVVIIDDEADYATPNAKINRDEKTKINELIGKLLEKNNSHYIGVTATPARLDLNNTFDNVAKDWVRFDPYSGYVGQDFFFPENSEMLQYRSHFFDPDKNDSNTKLEPAIFHFLCGVAEQHLTRNNKENFSMIIHTSGKIGEHKEDIENVSKVVRKLQDPNNANFNASCRKILEIAEKKYDGDAEEILEFILNNIWRKQIVEVNTEGKKQRKTQDIDDALKPTCLFSFVIGGNIISRGITFDNLLSMYFTRTVKGKFTQDTYIQRARMFGHRDKYKCDFQLWAPEPLMQEWAKCFLFHKLAIQSIIKNNNVPTWISDKTVFPTSSASIDRSSVDFEGGEMSWAVFKFDENRHERCMVSEKSTEEILKEMKQTFKAHEFPEHIFEYLLTEARADSNNICFHKASEFGGSSSKYSDEEVKSIQRKKGIFSTNEYKRGNRPDALHHLKIFYNHHGDARLLYKVQGNKIRFIQRNQ